MPLSPEERKRQRAQRDRFRYARRAEIWYRTQLKRIAEQIGLLTGSYKLDDPGSVSLLTQALREYARIILPWSRNTASRMLADVAKRDEQAWFESARAIGTGLRLEIATAPTGVIMQALLAEQVALITSLPTEAALRVQQLAQEAHVGGSRGKEIEEMILASGDVAKYRAVTIARTEVARSQSILTQVRAEHIGATHYVWQTAKDYDVREAHRHMQGKVVPFASPPEVEPGKFYHAGQIYNCRCWMEVILPPPA